MKSSSLFTVVRITDTRNTDREILVFKYLKTIERPKEQNLYSPFLYQLPHARTTKKKPSAFTLVLYYERFRLP